MLTALAKCIAFIVGLIWQKHVTLGEKAGQAEQKVTDQGVTISALNRELQASDAAPSNKQELIDTLKQGDI